MSSHCFRHALIDSDLSEATDTTPLGTDHHLAPLLVQDIVLLQKSVKCVETLIKSQGPTKLRQPERI